MLSLHFDFPVMNVGICFGDFLPKSGRGTWRPALQNTPHLIPGELEKLVTLIVAQGYGPVAMGLSESIDPCNDSPDGVGAQECHRWQTRSPKGELKENFSQDADLKVDRAPSSFGKAIVSYTQR